MVLGPRASPEVEEDGFRLALGSEQLTEGLQEHRIRGLAAEEGECDDVASACRGHRQPGRCRALASPSHITRTSGLKWLGVK